MLLICARLKTALDAIMNELQDGTLTHCVTKRDRQHDTRKSFSI